MKNVRKYLPILLAVSVVKNVYAYTITHTDYQSGGSITANGQNSNENAMVNLLNGNIDTTNIAANGVGTTQIAAQAVTAAKMAPNSVSTASYVGSGDLASVGGVNKATATITTAGNTVLILGMARCTFSSVSTTMVAYLTRDGSTFSNNRFAASPPNAANQTNTMPIMSFDTPGAGSHTYNLYIDCGTGTYFSHTFGVLELKS